MDVLAIVRSHLESIGADGLVNDEGCGCRLNDLIPCELVCSECTPGRCVPVPDGEDPDLDFWMEPMEEEDFTEDRRTRELSIPDEIGGAMLAEEYAAEEAANDLSAVAQLRESLAAAHDGHLAAQRRAVEAEDERDEAKRSEARAWQDVRAHKLALGGGEECKRLCDVADARPGEPFVLKGIEGLIKERDATRADAERLAEALRELWIHREGVAGERALDALRAHDGKGGAK